MILNELEKLLSTNAYPGRGIVLGTSEDGKSSVAVYFIMGRSENSRNRVFEETEDGIRTKAYDLEKLTDPSLVIYHPVRVNNGRIIVTNGAQTDTVMAYLQRGSDFQSALHEWEYEPDPPIYTPRISGLMEKDGSYSLSILKSADGNPACCVRNFYNYSKGIAGTGHFISTYATDGNPPPSFKGEPVAVKIELSNGLRKFAESIWDSLSADNKVSLYARETVLLTGEVNELIINKHGGSGE